MEWLEVSVAVEPEAAEAVAEVFSRYAYHGTAIEAGPDGWHTGPVVVKAFLSTDDELWAKKREIEEALWHLGQIQPIPEPSYRSVAEKDWSEAWKEQLEVLRIGQHIVIQPSWRDYDPRPDDVVIQLDPGMAFGTGLHPTTQLCLEALEDLISPGDEVLDLGTGSGILAIAAAKLGAGSVLGVDNDPQAVEIARNNARANGVDEIICVKEGSLPEVSSSYDLVMVNILARVIIEMTEGGLASRLRDGGTLVAAGITVEQVPEVAAALERGQLALLEQNQKDDWVSLLMKRSYSPRS